jgi:hypothetical protein
MESRLPLPRRERARSIRLFEVRVKFPLPASSLLPVKTGHHTLTHHRDWRTTRKVSAPSQNYQGCTLVFGKSLLNLCGCGYKFFAIKDSSFLKKEALVSPNMWPKKRRFVLLPHSSHEQLHLQDCPYPPSKSRRSWLVQSQVSSVASRNRSTAFGIK